MYIRKCVHMVLLFFVRSRYVVKWSANGVAGENTSVMPFAPCVTQKRSYIALTSSNSFWTSSSGALVRRLKTTMKIADTAKAGASS